MVRATLARVWAFVQEALGLWFRDVRDDYRPHLTTACLTALGCGIAYLLT